MASLLPKLSSPSPPSSSLPPTRLLRLQRSVLQRAAAASHSCPSLSLSSPVFTKREPRLALSLPSTLPQDQKQQQQQLSPPPPPDHHHKSQFYINLGAAVRTLREDMPALFSRDLNYDIYRDDITFVDPLNTFHGIDNYKLIFWALRFHGRILFREISLEVFRVWQPSENVILIRWSLRGVPRVPWEAKGEFQGTSRYKLDRHGKIYEHKVDNLAFNFPRVAPMGSSTVLDLVAAVCPPASPNLTFLPWEPPQGDAYPCSWVEFYRAVKETLDRGEEDFVARVHDGLVACS